MSVATAARPKPAKLRADIVEASRMDGPALTVDKAGGVIKGVKVVGRNSPNSHNQPGANRTEYTDAALKGALPLYEGAQVMCDHPADRKRPAQERGVRESIGVLRNCQLCEDGIRADLHYSRVHPMAAEIVEDVERRLGRFGLSHNARGEGTVRGGAYIVESIPEVRSVDLVTRPATNKNLWESAAVPQTTTLRALVESFKATDPKRLAVVAQLLESGGMSDLPAPEAAADANAQDALRAGFQAAGAALIEQVVNGTADARPKLTKLLEAHAQLTATEATTDMTESTDDAAKADRGRLETLEAKDKARDLCETLGFVPTKDQLAALVECKSDAARKTVAESFKAGNKPAITPTPRNRPVSRMPGEITESRQDNPTRPADAKAFVAALRS